MKTPTNKLTIQRMLQGPCTHDVKVSFMKKVGWCIRIFTNGNVNQEAVVKNTTEIGPTIRDLLRMEDKCGNISDMAHNARMRPGRKAIKRRQELPSVP